MLGVEELERGGSPGSKDSKNLGGPLDFCKDEATVKYADLVPPCWQ
jgi:hypothetical protein